MILGFVLGMGLLTTPLLLGEPAGSTCCQPRSTG